MNTNKNIRLKHEIEIIQNHRKRENKEAKNVGCWVKEEEARRSISLGPLMESAVGEGWLMFWKFPDFHTI